MAIPFINILAPSLGGIGPIELADFNRLTRLNGNGIPFYAGRFYPKDSTGIWIERDGIKNQIGLIAETPPWYCWENIDPTQIWMIAGVPQEKIITTTTSIVRIDWWPREEDDGLPENPQATNGWDYTPNDWEKSRARAGWGWGSAGGISTALDTDSLDPLVEIQNDLIPPLLLQGSVGISGIQGRCSEYAFFDQELRYMNGTGLNQNSFENEFYAENYPDGYRDLWRLRSDGAWKKRNAEVPNTGVLEWPTESNGYMPNGWTRDSGSDIPYLTSAITDPLLANRYGTEFWNEYTRYNSDGPSARMGQLLEITPTLFDTVVYTIKVSCVTVTIQDPPDDVVLEAGLNGQDVTLGDYRLGLSDTLANNLLSNIWYFYWPVRFDARYAELRNEFLLNRAGIEYPGFAPP